MDAIAQIQAEIAKLQKQAEDMISQRKTAVIEEMRTNIKTYGITPKDLGLTGTPIVRAGITVPIKYRFQNHTWTGRGRQPKWVEEYLASGGKLDDVLVK